MSKIWFLKKMIFVFWNLIYEIWFLKSDFWNLDFWNLISLPKAMSICRSEILRKQEHKVSYRCSLPSPFQKRSKDFKGLQGLDRCQNPAGQQRTFLRLVPHMNPWDLLRLPPGLLVLRFDIKLFWSPDGSLRSSKFMCDTKAKEVLCWVLAPMQSIDPWISSAMAMAMSIYRTLCVLVWNPSLTFPFSILRSF